MKDFDNMKCLDDQHRFRLLGARLLLFLSNASYEVSMEKIYLTLKVQLKYFGLSIF